MRFRDRRDAGRRLADELGGTTSMILSSSPYPGVACLSAMRSRRHWVRRSRSIVTRKIGAPGHQEFGIGAIAEDGFVVASDAVHTIGLSREDVRSLGGARGSGDCNGRVERYRGDRPLPPLEDRDVILVDDGIATGVTAEAALRAFRRHHPGGSSWRRPPARPRRLASGDDRGRRRVRRRARAVRRRRPVVRAVRPDDRRRGHRTARAVTDASALSVVRPAVSPTDRLRVRHDVAI